MRIGKLTIEINVSWGKSYMSEIIQHLREGRKFQAYKTYKDATGKDAQKSKDFIEKLCPKYFDKKIKN
jgi:hypothetical protein